MLVILTEESNTFLGCEINKQYILSKNTVLCHDGDIPKEASQHKQTKENLSAVTFWILKPKEKKP